MQAALFFDTYNPKISVKLWAPQKCAVAADKWVRQVSFVNIFFSAMFSIAVIGSGLASEPLRFFFYYYLYCLLFILILARIHQFSGLVGNSVLYLSVIYLAIVFFSVSDFSGVKFLLFNLIFVCFFLVGAHPSAKLLPPLVRFFSFILGLGAVVLHLAAGGLLFQNSNYAAAIFVILMFPLLASLHGFRLILTWLLVVGVAASLNSRSVVLSFILASLFAGAIFTDQGIWRRIALWSLLVGASSATIALFIGYYNYPILMDQFFLDFSGKRFESGRVDIWSVVIDGLTATQVIFGSGVGGTYHTDEGDVLSVHSSYVFLIARVGVLGLIAFILLMADQLRRLWFEGYTWSFLASVFLLMRDFFETSIVANNIPIAAFFWLYALSGELDKSSLLNSKTRLRNFHETNPPEPVHRAV